MGTVFYVGIVAAIVGYMLHAALLPYWRRQTLHRYTFLPLGILIWAGVLGIAAGVGFLLYQLVAGAGFMVVLPLALLVILFGIIYQVRDLLMYEEVSPFIRDSFTFSHSSRVRRSVFAGAEQKDIEARALSEADRKVIQDLHRGARQPMDRARELAELEAVRRKRKQSVGREELDTLARGLTSDITDLCTLHHVDSLPHALFGRMYRLTIDPVQRRCLSCIVFDRSTRTALRDQKRWFRFEQDLFDFAQALYQQDWMARFKTFYEVLALECHHEEADSFGLPQRIAFLRVAIPASVIEQYRDRIFIATELERVATVTWLGENEQ